MCGIIAIVHNSPTPNLVSMMDSIAHRGPDSRGFYQSEHVSLGHLRLSIQDLSPSGHQPMVSEDGKYIIILNGEIYNHKEIREEISHKYTFKSTGDTETLLYAFAEYGPVIFNKLNGIFAAVIYDMEQHKVYIVRDHFGIKPLYYAQCGTDVCFSSEIKAIRKHLHFDNAVNENALANYLYFLWSPGEDTPYTAVKKLLPGHYITIDLADNKNLKFTKYYELPFKGEYAQKTEEEWIDELEERLTKAVSRQLLSDVPVGFFLSGGLDSSLIVAIAKKLNPNKRILCFTIDAATNGDGEGFVEDLPYAKKVAQYLDVDLEIIRADIDILRDFDKMVYHLDEPQADAAPLNVMNICKRARELGVIVLLGGTAGDDLFSGYRRHQSLYYKDKLAWIPQPLKKIIYSIAKLLPKSNATTRRIAKMFSQFKESDDQKQLASLYGWLDSDVVKGLFKHDLEFEPSKYLVSKLNNIPNEKSSLNKLLFWDIKYFLTDHNLNYTDKMSMAYGVEVRVPFLDIELVEFSTRIPPKLKMKGVETKYLLKKVAERYLPHDVIYRPKTGFGAPVREWITDDLQPMLKNYLSAQNISQVGIFDYEAVWKLIEENQTGKVDASYSIWALLAIHSLFINNSTE